MRRAFKRKYVLSVRSSIPVLLGLFLLSGIFAGSYWILRLIRQTGLTPRIVYQMIFRPDEVLSSDKKRTNILLLGIGGGDHDGSDLTDTMMVLSIDSGNPSIALISIPRDIWSDTLKDKVNTAYHYGNEKKKGGGLTLAKVVVEDVTGLVIPYSIRIDFSGFKKIIDLIGGVDVPVTTAFTDTEYPIPGKEHDSCPGDPSNRCVYETVHFDAGIQHMNGDRALVYVRSRHADGSEGNDFARNRRQQEVIIALKNKLTDVRSWVTVERLKKLRQLYEESVETDMKTGEITAVGLRFVRTAQSSFYKIPVDTLFIQPPEYLYGGRFVLTPAESWDTVHASIARQLR